jgi:aldose sugar dehydrogenase
MRLAPLPLAFGLVLAACGMPQSSNAQSPQAGRAQADSDRGRAAGLPFTMAEVTRFETPWAMAFLPGSGLPRTNMALVTEREGRLWLVDVARGRRQAVSGVPSVEVAGQGGLGDVVPHPDFAGNGRIYLSFVEAGPGGTSGAAVGYGRLVLGQGEPRIDGFRVIWRQIPKVSGNGHFAHRIVFAPDGTMFVSSGERQKFDPAQDMSGNLGKIVRLTAEGQPAPGNPFASRGAAAAQVYTLGMRNNLGLAFDADGRLWASEMGPKGGDELNLVEAGKNYGYPIVSDGDHYDGRDIPDHNTNRSFAAPKLSWNPSISPAGMIIYRGALFPEWQGDALIAALSGEALVRADLDGTEARKADRWNLGFRVREVEEGPRGEIFLLQDGRGGPGRLLRLEPRR